MFFDRITHSDPQKIALKYEGKQYTYAQILEETTQRAKYFFEIQRSVLLNKPNPIENFLDFLACMYLGKKAIFITPTTPDLGLQAYKQRFDGVSSLDCKNAYLFDIQFFKSISSDIFLGVLTSGTTGEPKVIWKDYQAWFSAFEYQSAVFGISETDTVFVLDALAYSANLNAVLHALWQGCTVVLGKLSEAKYWQTHLENQAVTSVFLVPSHLALFKNIVVKFDKVKSIVTAGEKLKQKVAKDISLYFPNALITEYYGAAELGHISYIQGNELLENSHSVGRAFPGVSLKLLDNQIFVKSFYVSPDFRNKPTVSDLGEIGADGLLYLLGREGRMYNKRGLNIFAQEIENAAEEHPLVVTAYLVQNDSRESVLDLWVEYSAPLESADLRSFLSLKLSSDKLPNHIYCLAKLPRHSSGKINFKALQKILSEENIEA